MTLLVQITDTHIVERGKLLYGLADTARHLAESVAEINAMRPRPDAVLGTPVILAPDTCNLEAQRDRLVGEDVRECGHVAWNAP